MKHRLAKYLMLDEGWNIDINDTDHITLIGRTYVYYIDNMKYGTTFVHKGNSDWEIIFGNIDKNNKINTKMLNIFTPTTVKKILSDVSKTIAMFIKLKRPRSIMYVTDTQSKVDAYKRLFNFLTKSSVTGYKLVNYNENFHYIIKNNYNIEDIVMRG